MIVSGQIRHPNRYAFLAMAGLLFFEYARPQAWIGALGALHLPLLLGGALIVWWLLVDRAQGLFDPLIWPALGLLVLGAISVGDAANQGRAFSAVQSLAITIFSLTIPLARVLRDPGRFHRVMVVWVVALASAGVHAVLHNGVGPGGFLGDENDLALAMVMLLALAWYQATNPQLSWWVRWLFGAAVVVAVAAVIASNSRGGFLALVAVAGSLVWFSRRRILAIGIALVLALGAWMAVPDQYVEEMQSIEDTEDSTRNDRLWSWKMAVEMWKDHPLLGVGIASYPWNVLEYELNSPDYDPYTMRLHLTRVSHSLYFDVLSEYGLIGGALYGLLVWRVFAASRRVFLANTPDTATNSTITATATATATASATATATQALWAQALAVALIGYLAAGVFISVEYYPHLFVLAGLASAAGSFLPRTAEADDEAEGAASHANAAIPTSFRNSPLKVT